MTEPVICKEGKCKYKYRQHIDECIDCDIVEEIDKELLKKSMTGW